MVWLIILLAALLVFVLLWRTARLDRGAIELVGMGLCLAIAGYTWQGRPGLAGTTSVGEERNEQARIGGETFAALRPAILGRFDRAGAWLTIADSYLRAGDTLNAVAILRSGIRQHPADADLWIGLGNALQLHGEGTMTAAATLAFERAQQLAPGNPAPTFFYGQALAQSGDLAKAETAWRSVLADLPPGTSWRPLVEERLSLLARVRVMQALQQQQQQQPVPEGNQSQ